MKKLIFGVFAHPDDEAFGPSATLVKEVKEGAEVHLITLTAGEAGMNPDELDNLGDVRLDEWRHAGELIGATSMHALGYMDGTLNNIDHITIAAQIEQIVRETVGGRTECTIELMSMDLNGITGHIDHIVAGRSACLAYYHLKAAHLPVTRVRLACITHDHTPEPNVDFVYMQPGHPDHEVSETVDAREYVDIVYDIINAHHTQRSDGEFHTAHLGDRVAINHFIDIR